jgi:hypothetical protein
MESFSLEERLLDLQAGLEQERLQGQASEKDKILERKLQQKVELASPRSLQGEWIREHKNLMATIHRQEAELHRKVLAFFCSFLWKELNVDTLECKLDCQAVVADLVKLLCRRAFRPAKQMFARFALIYLFRES